MRPDAPLLVTGSCGLVGSEVVRTFDRLGLAVCGVDNNLRAELFGAAGDTRWNRRRLEAECRGYRHADLDIRDRSAIEALVARLRPAAVVHAAAQPSHDLAARRPFLDFDVNAVGTLNLLEAVRRHAPEAPFVHFSTNKVYGDAPNRLPLVEEETRWDFARPQDRAGIGEELSVDRSLHSLFGASKLAADVLVQEYGRYFGMATCCLRCGCLTGPSHSGVELHGFLSYLVRCNVEGRRYRVYGYGGKQVRDNIHAADVVSFVGEFLAAPRCGEVYNLGGGRESSISILEAFRLVAELSGREMSWEYVDAPRKGDHICYISDLSKCRTHYPGWRITRDLGDIVEEMLGAWRERLER